MDKEQLINLCKVNDLIENFSENLNTLEKLSTLKFDIQVDDLDHFTKCFKSFIGQKRGQYRKLIALITKDNLVDNKEHANLLEMLRENLSKEIIELCERVIEICKNIMTNNKITNKKINLYFYKTIADHYRYIHEISEDEEIKNKAKEEYEIALKIAQEGKFLATDLIYLTFYLNYSVFLHDTMREREEAIQVSRNCLHGALKNTEEIVDNNQKDIILICQMIKDNISLWKNEKNDALKI